MLVVLALLAPLLLADALKARASPFTPHAASAVAQMISPQVLSEGMAAAAGGADQSSLADFFTEHLIELANAQRAEVGLPPHPTRKQRLTASPK